MNGTYAPPARCISSLPLKGCGGSCRENAMSKLLPKVSDATKRKLSI